MAARFQDERGEWGPTGRDDFFLLRLAFFPSPLVGEGGIGGRRPPYLGKDADALHRLWARSGSETDEGFVSAERTPHPLSLREGTFSHKGRRKKTRGEQRNYFPAFLPRGWLSRCRRSRCMRMWAASAEVFASAMARSKAVRASSLRPSCIRNAPRTPKK